MASAAMFRLISAGMLLISRGEREDERGQTLVEYALIIALMSIAIAASLTALSTGIGGVFEKTVGQF